MRSIYLLFFVVLTFNCFTQEIKSITVKHDSLVLIGNDLAVLYKKSKSALFDISNSKYKIPYQREYLHYFENGHTLISISENGDIKEYDWRNGFTDSTEVKKHFSRYMIEESLEFSCTAFNEDLIIIQDYIYPHNYSYPLLNVYGEDSIDQNGNVVYPAPEPEVCSSGVFNRKTGKWEIDPLFRSVHHMNDDIFAFHGQKENDSTIRVDWYDYEDKSFKLHKTFLKKNIEFNEKKTILSKSLALDSLQKVPGTNNRYYLYKEVRVGLVSFNILSETSFFVFEVLSPLEFDLVIYHPGSRSIVEYDGENFQYHSDREDQRDSIVEFSTYFRINDFAESENSVLTGREAKLSRENHSNFSVQLIGQYAMVTNITPQFVYDFPLHTEYGNDSVDENANLVYPDPIPGAYSSGVFNLEKKKWIVFPQHREIKSMGNGSFLANNFSLDSNGLVLDESDIQTVYDQEGEIVARIADFKHSKPLDLAKVILGGDSVFYSSYQYEPISLIEEAEYDLSHVFFTVQNNDKMNAYEVILDKGNHIVSVEKLDDGKAQLTLAFSPMSHGDFPSPLKVIFKNINGEYMVRIRTQLSELNDTSAIIEPLKPPGLLEFIYPNGMVSYNDGIVNLLYKDSSNSTEITRWVILEKDDAISSIQLSASEYNSLFQSFYNPIHYRITHSDDRVLVQNAPLQYSKSTLLSDFGDSYTEINRSVYFESENNYLWCKQTDQWSKQGRNYALLTETSYGYIGRTSKVRNQYEPFYLDDVERVDYDSLKQTINDQDSKYQLLDSTFSPYTYKGETYFSSIKQYPFGYQLFSDFDSSVLVSIEGETLCEDHFEKYYLEDGVLYGENDVVYKIDPEFGDYIFDDQGNPVIHREAEKREIDR